jgi:hypothetical protein
MNGQQAPTGLSSDEDRAKMLAQAEANAKTACLCTIQNAGKRAQVIYDGIHNASPIHFAIGETKQGVRLAEHMVARLQEEENSGDPENPNLRIVDWAHAEPEAPVAPRPMRKPRPTRAAPAAA